MDLGFFRDYCLSKKSVSEEYPFGETTMVLKVMGRIFAIADTVTFESISLKAKPDQVVDLRERYAAVRRGYHLNKMHWITLTLDGSVPDRMILGWIDDSYGLVAEGLPKSVKLRLKAL